MESRSAIAEIQRLIAGAEGLPADAKSGTFAEWQQRAASVLKRALPPDSDIPPNFSAIRFTPKVSSDRSFDAKVFGEGLSRAVGILRAAVFEIESIAESGDVINAATIDPELWEHVRLHVEYGDWNAVASQAAIFCEDRIRRWAKRPAGDLGFNLMTSVFDPNNGVFIMGNEPNERQGWHRLAMAIPMALGNVDRHHIQNRDDLKTYAVGVLGTISLLLTQVRHQYGDQLPEN